jgi:lambda repressor-like predicted transcriptional regulator
MLPQHSKKREGNMHIDFCCEPLAPNNPEPSSLLMHQPDQASNQRTQPRQGVTAMHPEDIKASLKKKGSSQAKIAKTLNLSRSTVAHVIMGHSKSRRVANEISRVTGLSLERLWPGRYTSQNDDATA